MSRITAREDTFKLIYSRLVGGETDELYLAEITADREQSDADYIRKVSGLIEEKLAFLESVVERYSKGYTLDRVYKVDRAILLVAVCEILFTDVPPKAAVNEALNLSKVYSSEKSAGFINGILASVIAEAETLRIQAETFGLDEEEQL